MRLKRRASENQACLNTHFIYSHTLGVVTGSASAVRRRSKYVYVDERSDRGSALIYVCSTLSLTLRVLHGFAAVLPFYPTLHVQKLSWCGAPVCVSLLRPCATCYWVHRVGRKRSTRRNKSNMVASRKQANPEEAKKQSAIVAAFAQNLLQQPHAPRASAVQVTSSGFVPRSSETEEAKKDT